MFLFFKIMDTIYLKHVPYRKEKAFGVWKESETKEWRFKDIEKECVPNQCYETTLTR